VILPLILSFLATLTAAVMAYGTHPSRSLRVIMWTYRLQWPLIAISVILCLVLIGLVISGKRRAWWLIALGPVMALFAHRFLTSPVNRYGIADEPTFVAASDAKFVADDDYVIGLTFNDQAYAYPFGCVYRFPIVVQSDREHRLLLMWNPRANAAIAVTVTRETKARDLSIVSDPMDGLLLHSSRTGQFIAAIAGLTPHREKPIGVDERVAVMKMTWKQWKAIQPETRVMQPYDGSYSSATKPLPPRYPGDHQVVVVGDSPATAFAPQNIGTAPLNNTMSIIGNQVPVVVFREPASNRVVAFDRRLSEDLVLGFRTNDDPKRKGAFVDDDTNTTWNLHGVAVDGAKEMLGKRLQALPVIEDAYLTPVLWWYGFGITLDTSSKSQGADHAPTRPSLEDRKSPAGNHHAAKQPRPKRSARSRP
jgi:hypothetical protein